MNTLKLPSFPAPIPSPLSPRKIVSFKEVVHDIFPSKHKLTLQSSSSKSDMLSSGMRPFESEKKTNEYLDNASALRFRKTTSSLLFVGKLLKRLPKSNTIIPNNREKEMNMNLRDANDLEKAKEILKKKKENRTVAEIKALAKSFESIDLFSEIKKGIETNLYEKLFKELIFEEMPTNQFIFRINDPPDKLYIILSGEVYILAPKDNNPQNEPNNANISMENSAFPGYIIINTMKKFQSFGEIALKNNTKRTASAACKSACQLVSLDFKIFRLVLKAFFEGQAAERMDYLKKVPLFNKIPHHYLEGLILHLKEKVFHKGDVIFKEGSKTDCLYIVKEGEVEVSKIINLNHLKTHILQDKCNSEEKMMQFSCQKEMEKLAILNSSWARKLILRNKKHYILSTLHKGESFGEKGINNPNNIEEFTMTVKSLDAVIFVLSYQKINENLKHLDQIYGLNFKTTLIKNNKQREFLRKIVQTEGLIMKGLSEESEIDEIQQNSSNLNQINSNKANEKQQEFLLNYSGTAFRRFRADKHAYEITSKAKYHYTTRYLPSNLLLKKNITESFEATSSEFQEFTLEKNLLKLFNPRGVNLRKMNSNNSEFIKENKDLSLKSTRPFSEIMKELESSTKKNVLNFILYKSLKVKHDSAQKVYKYCSEKIKTNNTTSNNDNEIRSLKKEKKSGSLILTEKKKSSNDECYNFCHLP